MAHLPVQEIVWNHLAVIIRCGPGHDPRFAILKVKCNTRLCSLRTQDFPAPLHCTTQQNPPSASPPSHINPYMHSHTAAYAQAHTLSLHTYYSMHTPRVDWPWWHPWYRSQWWAVLSRQTLPGPPHTAQPTFSTAPASPSVWTPLSEPAHTRTHIWLSSQYELISYNCARNNKSHNSSSSGPPSSPTSTQFKTKTHTQHPPLPPPPFPYAHSKKLHWRLSSISVTAVNCVPCYSVLLQSGLLLLRWQHLLFNFLSMLKLIASSPFPFLSACLPTHMHTHTHIHKHTLTCGYVHKYTQCHSHT